MKKGTTAERMVYLVVAVCLGLFILWFLLSRLFPSLIQQIEWLLGYSKPTDIEMAAMCSMYRCTEGCDSMNVQKLSWESGGKTVKCQDFCGAALPSDAFKQGSCTCKLKLGNVKDTYQCLGSCEETGKTCSPDGDDCQEKIINPADLKVCGSDYPVTITLKNDETIDLSHLALGSSSIPDVRCMFASDSGDAGAWESFANILVNILNLNDIQVFWQALGGGGDNLLIVNPGLIRSYGNKVGCNWGVFSADSYQELSVKSGQEIKIVSEMGSWGTSNALTTYAKP